MPTTSTTREWFAEGLRFTCTQCGNCCTGGPGVVWFNDREAQAMADFLKISKHDFLHRYARRVYGRWSLNEHRTDQGMDCTFLRRDPDGKALCSVYPVRPRQCQTWPFWPENLVSRQAWEEAGARCPGMKAGNNGQGNFYPVEQIRIIRDSNDAD